MEPEGSLSLLQVSAICPYPEPDRSSLYPHIPIPEYLSQYYPPIYAWVFQMVSFLQVSPPRVTAQTKMQIPRKRCQLSFHIQ